MGKLLHYSIQDHTPAHSEGCQWCNGTDLGCSSHTEHRPQPEQLAWGMHKVPQWTQCRGLIYRWQIHLSEAAERRKSEQRGFVLCNSQVAKSKDLTWKHQAKVLAGIVSLSIACV